MTIHTQTIESQVADRQSVDLCFGIDSRPSQRSSPRGLTKVLLLDGYSTRTLACVRSWGMRGVPFAVGGETRRDMSLFSRYAKETFIYSSPKQNVAKFIQDVNRHCRKFRAECVFPTSEAAITACSSHRAELDCIPVIPSEVEIQTTFSKANTLKLAQSLGILIPATVLVTGPQLPALDVIAPGFPLVVKSESSEALLTNTVRASAKTTVVFDHAELRRECEARLATQRSVVLQQFVDGYGVGISGLFDQGRPVALVGHRRVRESTPWGGPSALAETIEIDPNLLRATTALFKKIGFSGPAMAEYKVDRRTHQPYLMEINGRFWGSVLLATVAGQDLPYLYWKMLNGIAIQPEETRYRIGVRGRYIVGDTKCLLLSLKGAPKRWPGQAVKRASALKSYLSSFFDGRTTELIFTIDDPMPFLGRLLRPSS